MTSSRIEDMSWPARPDAGSLDTLADLIVAKMQDRGLVHDERPLLSLGEAARRLNVSERTIGDMIRAVPPRLASVKVGMSDARGAGQKGIMIEPREVDAYLEAQRRLALAGSGRDDRDSNH